MLYYFCRNNRNFRLVSIIAIAIAIYLPSSGFCETRNFFDQPEDELKQALIERFDKLEEKTRESKQPFLEGYHFLETFIEEINAQYGCSFTMLEACTLVRTNLDQFQLPPKAQSALIKLIEFIETTEAQKKVPSNRFNTMLSKISMNHAFAIYPSSIGPAPEEKDPSDSIIIGSVELLGGALLCVIPHPVSYGVGMILIGDGAARIFDDITSEEDPPKDSK